jgi:hypothetical protein
MAALAVYLAQHGVAGNSVAVGFGTLRKACFQSALAEIVEQGLG